MECQRNVMLCYLYNRGRFVCTRMYTEVCTPALLWVAFLTTRTVALLEGKTSKLAEGWRSGSPALLLRGPVDPAGGGGSVDPAGPCGPEPRLGLKPKDTGKVK